MARKVLLLSFLILYCWKGENFASRVRRQKLYPPPIVYPLGGTFKFQYALPQNATFFTEFFNDASSSRRRRESISWNERMTVYNLLEEEFERKGINGKECMKKSICEAAIMSLKDEGLVGELLHLLLTPQQGSNLSEYLQALEFGERNYDCSQIYKSCLSGQGILDQISKVIL